MSFQQKLEAEKARQRAEPVKKQELAEASNVEAIEAKREPVVGHEIQEEIKKPINFNGLKARKRTRVDDEVSPVLVDLSLSPRLKRVKISSSTSPVEDGNEVEEKRQFAPAKKAWSTGTVAYKTREIIENRKNLSDWYDNTNTNQKVDRGYLQIISDTKRIIDLCLEAVSRKNDAEINTRFDELRTKLHEMEFYEFPKLDVLIKKSKVLEDGGLKRIFEGSGALQFPWDIKADAETLYSRWMNGDRDPSLLRGLATTKSITEEGKKRYSHKLDSHYTQRRPADVVGPNGLSNGQWWPNRLCAIRDGAHGEHEAGIYGKKDRGAFAVVVAAGGYADEDHGETILYCGTESGTSKPTLGTTYLDLSYKKKQPLRVLRAVNKKSKYAPKEGIRYDGMYKIKHKEPLNAKTAMYRFTLQRLADQDPIRYQGVQTRPTQQELKQLKEVRELLA